MNLDADIVHLAAAGTASAIVFALVSKITSGLTVVPAILAGAAFTAAYRLPWGRKRGRSSEGGE